MESDSSPCVQKMLGDFIKRYCISLIGGIIISYLISYSIMLFQAQDNFIPENISKLILNSLNDVFIGFFGFVGLILVFIFNNILTMQRQLNKDKLDINIKLREIIFQRMTAERTVGMTVALEEAETICNQRLNETDNDLTDIKEKIRKAIFFGIMSISLAATCILINIWALGAIFDKGLHYQIVAIIVSLFFLSLHFIFEEITIVIR